jgi:hypothetical protein
MRPRKHTRRIIWHHSLSDYGDVDIIRKWHIARGFSDIGYHIVITPAGEIQYGRPLGSAGAHSLWRNADSIGVCLVGDFRKYEPPTKQLEASIRLVHDLSHALCWSHPLKMEFHRPHIFNLFERAEYNRLDACPGALLNREDFLELVMRGYL